MNKLIIALMAVIMLSVAGCATKSTTGKSNWTGATGTAIDIGDGAALPEIDATDDEAVDALPDTIAAE